MEYKIKTCTRIIVFLLLVVLLSPAVSFGSDDSVYTGGIIPLQIPDVYTGTVTPLQIILGESENLLEIAIKSCKYIDGACEPTSLFESNDEVYLLIHVRNLKVIDSSYELILKKQFGDYESTETISNKVLPSDVVNVEIIKEFSLNNDPGEYEYAIKITDKNSGQEAVQVLNLEVQ